jgi:TonB family protein
MTAATIAVMLRNTARFLLLLSFSACFPGETPAPKTLAEASTIALASSLLTAPGSRPFHLKLTIRDVQNPDSNDHGEIEEFWASPTQWKRIVTAPNLKHITIVDETGRHIESSGDYMPLWLRGFITAIEDPIPAVLRKNSEVVIQHPLLPNGSPAAPCAGIKLNFASVSAPAEVCFFSNYHLYSVSSPGYQMEFNEYGPFEGRDVPHLLLSGMGETLLVGKVVTLEKLSSKPDTFAVSASLSTVDPLASVMVPPSTIERLAKAPLAFNWPAVPGGPTSGNLTAYVSVDITGQVREVFILDSPNAHLMEAARRQLLAMKWNPAVSKGQPVQIASIMGLPFTTSLDSAASGSLPTQNNPSSVTRGRALSQPKPQYPPEARFQHISGSVYLSALIGKTGAVEKLGVIDSPSPILTDAAITAVKQWKYQPYLIDGVPVSVSTTITVNFLFSR